MARTRGEIGSMDKPLDGVAGEAGKLRLCVTQVPEMPRTTTNSTRRCAYLPKLISGKRDE